MNDFNVESAIVFIAVFVFFLYVVVAVVSSLLKSLADEAKKSSETGYSTQRRSSENPWWKGQEEGSRQAEMPSSWRTQKQRQKKQKTQKASEQDLQSRQVFPKEDSFQDGVRKMLGDIEEYESQAQADELQELEDIPKWADDEGYEDDVRALKTDFISRLFAQPENVISGVIYSEVLGPPKGSK